MAELLIRTTTRSGCRERVVTEPLSAEEMATIVGVLEYADVSSFEDWEARSALLAKLKEGL